MIFRMFSLKTARTYKDLFWHMSKLKELSASDFSFIKEFVESSEVSEFQASYLMTLVKQKQGKIDELLPLLEPKFRDVELNSPSSVSSLLFVGSSPTASWSNESANKFIQYLYKHSALLQSKQLFLTVNGIFKAKIPLADKQKYLNMFGERILNQMTMIEAYKRSMILTIYARVPGNYTERLIRAEINSSPLNLKSINDLSCICNVLSLYPLDDDAYLFRFVEEQVLKHTEIPSRSLVNLIHAFSKRKAGTDEFYSYMEELVERHLDEMKHNSLAIIYYSLARIGRRDSRLYEKLKTFNFESSNEKVHSATEYWKNIFKKPE